MVKKVLYVKKAGISHLEGLLELITECTGVRISMLKPAFKLTVEVTIEGEAERVEEAYNLLARYASRVGWRIE